VSTCLASASLTEALVASCSEATSPLLLARHGTAARPASELSVTGVGPTVKLPNPADPSPAVGVATSARISGSVKLLTCVGSDPVAGGASTDAFLAGCGNDPPLLPTAFCSIAGAAIATAADFGCHPEGAAPHCAGLSNAALAVATG